MPWTCVVPTCDSNTKRQVDVVSTFKSPDEETEKELYDKWVAAIPGCTVLKKKHRICEKHFRTGQIIKQYVTRTDAGEFISVNSYKHPRLVKGSVPCIFAKPGEQLDSHVYHEHAYVTKSINFGDETSNPSEGPPKNTELSQETTERIVINPNILSKLPNDQVLSNSAATAIFQSVTFDFDGKFNNPNTRVKLIIDLVKPWNAARATFGDKEYLILSHIIEAVASGKKGHTIEKAILISRDRKITYEVYGRPCDVGFYKLPKVLESVTKLTEILKRFKDLPVCEGVTIFNSNYLTTQRKNFYELPWRPDDCTLISLDEERCPGCQEQMILVSESNHRDSDYPKLPSISLQSNPIHQKKHSTMQNKTKHRTTLKARFKKSFDDSY